MRVYLWKYLLIVLGEINGSYSSALSVFSSSLFFGEELLTTFLFFSLSRLFVWALGDYKIMMHNDSKNNIAYISASASGSACFFICMNFCGVLHIVSKIRIHLPWWAMLAYSCSRCCSSYPSVFILIKLLYITNLTFNYHFKFDGVF